MGFPDFTCFHPILFGFCLFLISKLSLLRRRRMPRDTYIRGSRLNFQNQRHDSLPNIGINMMTIPKYSQTPAMLKHEPHTIEEA